MSIIERKEVHNQASELPMTSANQLPQKVSIQDRKHIPINKITREFESENTTISSFRGGRI